MSGLPPTVQGALIAGGAALIGFAASTWNTRVMVRGSREAAREQLLWHKKTELYEAISATLTATDVASYEIPFRQPDRDSLKAFRHAVTEHEPALRLYTSWSVKSEFYELQTRLRKLSTCADKGQAHFVSTVTDQQWRLMRAMGDDLQGTTPVTRLLPLIPQLLRLRLDRFKRQRKFAQALKRASRNHRTSE